MELLKSKEAEMTVIRLPLLQAVDLQKRFHNQVQAYHACRKERSI